MLEAVKAGVAVPAERQPEILRRESRRPTEAEFRRFREIEKRRDAHAHALGIDPTIIASKATIGDLARDWDKHAPELMHWQRELLKYRNWTACSCAFQFSRRRAARKSSSGCLTRATGASN